VSKFTPGPWNHFPAVQAFDVEGNPLTFIAARVTQHSSAVPEVNGQPAYQPMPICTMDLADDVAEANARLIAAAPDLYEALNAVLDKWRLPVLGDPEANAVFRQAEAALAKARGEA